jgi:hypothetical protein
MEQKDRKFAAAELEEDGAIFRPLPLLLERTHVHVV